MRLPRHAELWLSGYLRNRLSAVSKRQNVRRVWLAVTDHYEPFWNRPPLEQASARVHLWGKKWREIASSVPRDSAGNRPIYSFFYPEEEYRAEFINALSEMTSEGIADVEVHIHHDREGRDEFIRKMSSFRDRLFHEHGLLREENGRIRFGFIHGNWALDNSLPGGQWCGLNDEITILRDLGCYADFTMPSGNSMSQSRIVNSIYWCTDDPQKPKSYDQGFPAKRGEWNKGDLLMVDGPLGLRWKGRLLPRLESGELAAYDLPTPYRVSRWFDFAPAVEEDQFIKLHTHGAPEHNANSLLGSGLKDLYELTKAEAERRGMQIYFVSAWQMYNAIRAVCAGIDPVQAARSSISRKTESQTKQV